VVSELAKLSDNIKFVVMDKESSGNCIIEMPDEIVDISVDTQMDNIREILGNIRF
jgi:flagellar assembly protein FliH